MKVHVVFNQYRVLGVFHQKENADVVYESERKEQFKIEDPDSRCMPDLEEIEMSDYTEPSQDWP